MENWGAYASAVWLAAARGKLFTQGCPPPNGGEICKNEAGGGTHALPIFNCIVPVKLPSKKWRDLILQVWHTDPLICPQCQHQMRVIAVIDQRVVIEKILRHLGQWNGTPPLAPARAPPDADAGR